MKLSEYIKDNRVALLTSVIGAAFFSILLRDRFKFCVNVKN